MSNIKAIKRDLLETLEEYCKDRGYGFQEFAGMAGWIDTIEKEAYARGYTDGVFNASLKPFMDNRAKQEGRA